MNDFEFGERYTEKILAGEWKGGGSNAGIIAEVVAGYIKEGNFRNIKEKIKVLSQHQENLKGERMLTDFSRGVYSRLERKLMGIMEGMKNGKEES